MDDRSAIGLLGARGLVGECLTSLLVSEGNEVIAFTRNSTECKTEWGVTWVQIDKYKNAQDYLNDPFHQLPLNPLQLHLKQSKPSLPLSKILNWVCVAPIWILPDYFNMLES